MRLQYFLIMVLFATAGMFCRQQSVVPVADSDSGSFFSQAASLPDNAAGRYFVHALFAPEITGSITAENPNQKAPVRNSILPGYRIFAKPFISVSSHKGAVHLHSRSTDYYVFSLGKILI